MKPFLLLAFVVLAVCGQAGVYAQRNDPTKTSSKKEKSEGSKLTYDNALRLYGPPDQEKQMRDGGLVCTWIQTDAVVGSVNTGRVVGGILKRWLSFLIRRGR